LLGRAFIRGRQPLSFGTQRIGRRLTLTDHTCFARFQVCSILEMSVLESEFRRRIQWNRPGMLRKRDLAPSWFRLLGRPAQSSGSWSLDLASGLKPSLSLCHPRLSLSRR
jgi:hypothetical protein